MLACVSVSPEPANSGPQESDASRVIKLNTQYRKIICQSAYCLPMGKQIILCTQYIDSNEILKYTLIR